MSCNADEFCAAFYFSDACHKFVAPDLEAVQVLLDEIKPDKKYKNVDCYLKFAPTISVSELNVVEISP